MVAVQGRTAEPVAERTEERELIKKPCHVKVGNVPLSAVESLRAADAMMTGERVGMGHDPSRGAACVEAWVAALKEDLREIRRAAADAQRHSDFVLARSREHQAERESAPVAATRAPAPRPALRPELPLPVSTRSFGPSR